MAGDHQPLSFRVLGPQDLGPFQALLEIYKQVFEATDVTLPPAAHLAQLLANPAYVVLVAEQAGEVVGGLSVHVLGSYWHAAPLAYIYDLGVHPAHQRKGIGRALVAALRDYCASHGIAEAFVQASADDAEAIAFYRSLVPREETPALQFTFGPNSGE